MPAVAVAETRALLANVKRLASGGAGHHRVGFLAEAVEAVHQARRVHVVARLVKRAQQAATAIETLGRQAGGQGEVGDVITIGIRVAVRRERVVGHSQIGRAVVAGREAHRVRVGQADVRRHPRLTRAFELGDDRPGGGTLWREVHRVGAEMARQHPVGGREMVAVVMMH